MLVHGFDLGQGTYKFVNTKRVGRTSLNTVVTCTRVSMPGQAKYPTGQTPAKTSLALTFSAYTSGTRMSLRKIWRSYSF
jgi:LysM repeat protein